MKPGPFGNTHSHGDLHSLEIIEDRCGARRKHGLPTRYTKGRFLGKGGFARCYEVQDMETREVYAAKIVAKASIAKPRAHAKLKSEIAIHRSLNHDKVVKFYDHFEDSDYVYIILELCPNQTLNEFMRKRPNKRLSEPEAMFYVYDLIVALKYLHRRRVIHRDLKLGNLFLDADVRLKVGDFGLAAQLEHDSERRRTICGTPNYIAPEILEGKHGHSYEVDIWSLGVILYTMIIGRPPFETSDVRTTYRRIRYNQYSFPDTVNVSEQAKDLIHSILRTEPHSRLSLDEIIASPWFQGAQRLPPPMPTTVSAFSITPRVGSSSARSETPERGAADFARIDSPVPRFPLRDRSPSNVATPNSAAQHGLPRGQSASPLLPSKQPPVAPSYGGAMTPGRYTGGFPGGRPPLAHRGNEENVVPVNANVCGNHDTGAAYATPMSPKQNLIGGPAVPCRPQSANLASCGNSMRMGANHSTAHAGGTSPAPSAVLRGVVSASARDAVPSTAAAQVSAKVMGFSSARSTTCSPRQQPPLSSGRPVNNVSTPKENRSRSARALGSSSSEGGASASSLHTKSTPVVVRSCTQAPSARNPATAESPNPSGTQQLRASQQLTPCYGDTDAISARTPLATPPPPQVSCDKKQLPAQRSEWSSSSPALVVDALQRDAAHDASGKADLRLATEVRSARSSSHCEALGSGTFVPASASSHNPGVALQSGAMPELWVVKWVDYSSKYGVGYVLSDGCIGVYFNDSTKIVLAPKGELFDYVTRRTQDKPEVRSTHTFEDYPEDLKKKVTLLRHFRNYMHADVLEKKDGATVGESSLPPVQAPQAYEPGQSPYVKKWTRNKHAIMFQLSNKIVQVVFFDKTEAVLSSKSHTVTYVDKKGQVCSYPLSNVLDVPSAELAKRLRYTKDILVNLLGARTGDFAGVH